MVAKPRGSAGRSAATSCAAVTFLGSTGQAAAPVGTRAQGSKSLGAPAAKCRQRHGSTSPRTGQPQHAVLLPCTAFTPSQGHRSWAITRSTPEHRSALPVPSRVGSAGWGSAGPSVLPQTTVHSPECPSHLTPWHAWPPPCWQQHPSQQYPAAACKPAPPPSFRRLEAGGTRPEPLISVPPPNSQSHQRTKSAWFDRTCFFSNTLTGMNLYSQALIRPLIESCIIFSTRLPRISVRLIGRSCPSPHSFAHSLHCL